ncbi:MAG: PepSY domain-containing protein [Methylococcales bacterium]|nr:PepSY domain-containing protein [Methylococcales bacterium]
MSVFIKVFLLTFCLSQTVYAGNELVFSMLSLDQATKKIIDATQSKVLGAKTEQVEGKKIYVIKVLTIDGRVQHIKVDADSGEILK